DTARFDQAHFNQGAFAGGNCLEPGIFDFSRFVQHRAPVRAVFASGEPLEATAEVTVRMKAHRPGALAVNLPADLPSRFGGRFDHARFASSSGTPELFPQAVVEPPADQRYLVTMIKAGAKS